MNEKLDVAIREFAGYLDNHPNTEFSVGEQVFRIAKEHDCAPRDMFKEIVERLRK